MSSPPERRFSPRVIAGVGASLLVVVGLVALAGNDDGAAAISSLYWGSQGLLNLCPGPVWNDSLAAGLPTVETPKDSVCNHGLWTDDKSGSIRSYEISLTPENLQFLDADPRAEEYVPCNFTINYVPDALGAPNDDKIFIYDAKCRYKGSVGSFGSCTDENGALPPPTQTRQCKLSWKVNMKKALSHNRTEGPVMLMEGTTSMQFSGMSGEPSQLRTPLGYTMLNDAGFLSPCSTPVNVYVNGQYQGIYANTENTDSVMIARRAALLGAGGTGGTLYKEVWPLWTDPDAYADDNLGAAAIPGLNNPHVVAEGSNVATSREVFANLTRDATDCVNRGDAYCTAERASEILETYTDTTSFVNALVGLAIAGNWDSIYYDNHNYLTYVGENNKIYYVAWDLDQTLAADIEVNHGLTPSPGWAPNPWYTWNITSTQRDALCPQIPADSPLFHYNNQVYGSFTCAPVNKLMAKALKERFFETYNSVIGRVKALAKQHLARWEYQVSAGISCAYTDGYWPSLEWAQTALYGLTPPAAMGYNSKFSPIANFDTTASLMQWFDHYQTMWTALGNGNESAWQQPVWPLSYADYFDFQNQQFQSMVASCVQIDPSTGGPVVPTSPVQASSESEVCGPSCFLKPGCFQPGTADGNLCQQYCGAIFQNCANGIDNCDWLKAELQQSVLANTEDWL